jgi:hypothetical protein
MSSLESHLDFVNGQRAFHEKRAATFPPDSSRHKIHLSTARKFKALGDAIQAALPTLEIAERTKAKPKHLRLALTPSDVKDLPPELLEELSVAGDLIEFTILELMQELGGMASLDQLLVGLYRKTGDVHKRSAIVSRLYRMAQKGFVYGVPGKKGVYSVDPISESEAAKMFDIPDLFSDEAGGAS